jgi:hypothetical protein
MFHFTHQRSRTVVVGVITVGMAVALSSLGIVRAEYAQPAGSVTYDCGSGTACVTGSSTGSKTYGVYGTSTVRDGVHGVTASTNGYSGVAGIASGTSGSARGVYGSSSNGVGVYGMSSQTNGNAVEGTMSAGGGTGVYGYFSGGRNGGWGVAAESNDTTEMYEALGVQADNATTYIFDGANTANDRRCIIDPNANLTCDGVVKGGSAVQVRHRNSSGHHVLTYATESATATIEDVGTARMSAGVANVQIDPAFASVMDGKWYYVFLTPLGDTRGLYVRIKTPSAFQVRETEHGRDTLAFDYRIVAHPLDAKNDRLPSDPAMKRLRTMHQTQ